MILHGPGPFYACRATIFLGGELKELSIINKKIDDLDRFVEFEKKRVGFVRGVIDDRIDKVIERVDTIEKVVRANERALAKLTSKKWWRFWR